MRRRNYATRAVRPLEIGCKSSSKAMSSRMSLWGSCSERPSREMDCRITGSVARSYACFCHRFLASFGCCCQGLRRASRRWWKTLSSLALSASSERCHFSFPSPEATGLGFSCTGAGYFLRQAEIRKPASLVLIVRYGSHLIWFSISSNPTCSAISLAVSSVIPFCVSNSIPRSGLASAAILYCLNVSFEEVFNDFFILVPFLNFG